VTSFEEELHRAVDQRWTNAAALAQNLERFHERNAPARQEAERRLVQIAEDVRSFLIHHQVPPYKMMAGYSTRLQSRRLLCAASGWTIDNYFLTIEGRFVRFAYADPVRAPYGDSPTMKPGQRYIGHIGKAENLVREIKDGVANAIFVPESKPLATFYKSEAEFISYYYTDLPSFSDALPRQPLPCPGEALLLTPGNNELCMARLDNEGTVRVRRQDETIADGALRLVESHRGHDKRR
jgi:hypothetical protein